MLNRIKPTWQEYPSKFWVVVATTFIDVIGAIADKFGQRRMVLFGLVFSALSAVSMGLVHNLASFYLLAVIVGLLADMAGAAGDDRRHPA
jgi:sugar phosphate permease